MSLQNLTRFPRLELIGAPTPLEYLPRLSDHLGREIFIKRDDTTPLAMRATNCVSWVSRRRCAARGRGYLNHRRRDPV